MRPHFEGGLIHHVEVMVPLENPLRSIKSCTPVIQQALPQRCYESYFLDVDFTLSCTLVTHSRTESINRFNFGVALNQSHRIRGHRILNS